MIFKRIVTEHKTDVFETDKTIFKIVHDCGIEKGIFFRNPIVISYHNIIGITSPIYFKRLYLMYNCNSMNPKDYLQAITSKGFLLYPKFKNSNIYEKTIFNYADGNILKLVNRDEWYYTIRTNIEEALVEES